MVAQLIDAEMACTESPSRKASLLVEKALILEQRLSRDADARNALTAAIALEPSDLTLLIQLEQLFADWHGGRLSNADGAGDLARRETAMRLVAEGLAWAFVRYSDAYVSEEASARAASRGIWQARTEPPWEYREARWDRAAERSPRPGCPIKGNISVPSGERIYHTPWSANYERTVIDESKGERWFCDEAEAIAAGWRAARSR